MRLPFTTLIVINGKAGSGKDTFTSMCMEELQKRNVPCCCIHRSDQYKMYLESLGWDGEKTPEVRDVLKSLCQLGEIWGSNRDYLVNRIYTERVINHANSDNLVVFYHDRDLDSIQELKSDRKVKHVTDEIDTVLVVRPDAENLEPDSWYSKGMSPEGYERTINTNESLDNLRSQAVKLLKDLGV